MREIPREPDKGRFLLKAIGEAGRELAEELISISNREVDHCDAEGWSYRLVAAHVRDHEEMVLSYLERMLTRRDPRLEAIDVERVLEQPERVTDRIDRLLGEFIYLRRQTQELLWDLGPCDWDRRGIHEYRGPVTVLQLARELNQHDLQHLWQVRRMRDGAAHARR